MITLPTGSGRHVVQVPIRTGSLQADDEQSLTLIIINGKTNGPSTLITGGVHGDEYEGPAVLLELARELDSYALAGQLIIVPVMNKPALRARSRCSPEDKLDLNRVFPGKLGSTFTEEIAYLVAHHLVPHVDVVVDLHAGGEIENIIPSLMVHPSSNKKIQIRSIELLKAFGAPAGMIIDESNKIGMFDTFVESEGKLFACAELGGAGMLTKGTVQIARRGVHNLLVHLGHTNGKIQESQWKTWSKPKLMAAGPKGDIFVSNAGFYEPVVEIGSSVEKGEVIGRLSSIDDPFLMPAPLRSPIDGILYAQVTGGFVEDRELAATVAEPLSKESEIRHAMEA